MVLSTLTTFIWLIARSFVVALVLLLPLSANALLQIEITESGEGALPIAIVPFAWNGVGSLPEDIGAIVATDLSRSGLISPLAREDLLARPRSSLEVNFFNWKSAAIDYLVIGKLKAENDGSYIVQFQLFDVYKEQQMVGYSFPVRASQLRQVAHGISDIIFQKITGLPGAFDTRIAYVSAVKGVDGQRRYALQVSDSDGYNPQTVLTSKRPLMSPSWSPSARKIAYVSFEDPRVASVFVQDIDTGQRKKVSALPGINGAPVWSPDGKRLALTLSKGSNPDIYVLDLSTQRLTQVTRNGAIDTEPTWDPSGEVLVFTSDRSGGPQLYEKPISGGKARRLTFDGTYNASPTISPSGEKIAMVHGSKGQYRIAVIDRDSLDMHVLTNGRLDESPSFSPNGIMIIYAATGRYGSVLGAVSVDGRIKQRLTLSEGDVREPEWSPFLK